MRSALLGSLLTLAALPLAAQSPPAPPAPAPCTDAAHRQFDFWLGEWEVWARGNLDGRNTIARSADGCLLSEHWRSARGSEGRSMNVYDAAYGVWRQFWVGGDGGVLDLQGGIRDGAMVMSGNVRQADGKEQAQRITWTPQPDGSVEQRWETSDDGSQWTIVFLGEYRRASNVPASAAAAD